jgi:HSP20 family molecular chaperone IbpA
MAFWDPFAEMQRMHRDMQRLHQSVFSSDLDDDFFPLSGSGHVPRLAGGAGSSSAPSRDNQGQALTAAGNNSNNTASSLQPWSYPRQLRNIKVDVTEGPTAVTVHAELPGFGKGDVNLRLEENHLILSGEKKTANDQEEKNENGEVVFHRSERTFGSFSRAIPLPCPVKKDGVTAKSVNGVLEVIIPKQEPNDEAKQPGIAIEWD